MTKIFLSLTHFFGLTRPMLKLVVRFHNACRHLAGALASRLESGGLHPKHRITKYHEWFVERMEPGWTVLDVGCGNGALTADIADAVGGEGRVVAVDLNADNIAAARGGCSAENVEYVVGDATLDVPEVVPDAVVLSNVLEHIERRVDFLRGLPRKKGTLFLLRVPLVDRDWLVFLKREIGVEWRLDKTHLVEYTEEELRSELEGAGLSVEEPRRRFGEFYCVSRVVERGR